ncbi:hypothetical protein [Undibacterium sp. WLX3042]
MPHYSLYSMRAGKAQARTHQHQLQMAHQEWEWMDRKMSQAPPDKT